MLPLFGKLHIPPLAPNFENKT